MVFPEVMYGCENWTIKKTEHQRIDTFEDTADHLSMSSILHAPFHHMLTIFIDIIPTLLLRKL